jgi:hypothetical protein
VEVPEVKSAILNFPAGSPRKRRCAELELKNPDHRSGQEHRVEPALASRDCVFEEEDPIRTRWLAMPQATHGTSE